MGCIWNSEHQHFRGKRSLEGNLEKVMSQKMREELQTEGENMRVHGTCQSSAGLGKAVSEAWWGWISGIVGR